MTGLTKKKILIIYCRNPLMERGLTFSQHLLLLWSLHLQLMMHRVNACQVMPLCVSHYCTINNNGSSVDRNFSGNVCILIFKAPNGLVFGFCEPFNRKVCLEFVPSSKITPLSLKPLMTKHLTT